MPDIPASYASPGLRWSLLLEDHPGAKYSFEWKPANDASVPDEWGGDNKVCVATITFPAESGHEPVVAYREAVEQRSGGRVDDIEHRPDEWSKLCTKTLGRALKKAGYPDDMRDLKAMVVWRQRSAEIGAIGTGVAPAGELPPGQGDAADEVLDNAGRTEPDDVGADDSTSAVDSPPHPETVGAIREALGSLKADGQRQASEWGQQNGIAKIHDPGTEDQAQHVLMYLRGGAPDATDDVPAEGEPVDDGDTDDKLREAVRALPKDKVKAYHEFCDGLGANRDPAKMNDAEREAVREWLAPSE